MSKSKNEITAAELDGVLEKSFGGYKRDSVVSYVMQLNLEHNNEIKVANKLNDDLRAQVNELRTSNDEVFKKLNALQDQNAAAAKSAVVAQNAAGRESELKNMIRTLQAQKQAAESKLQESNQKLRVMYQQFKTMQAREKQLSERQVVHTPVMNTPTEPARPVVNPDALKEKDSQIEQLTLENQKQKMRTKQIIAQAKMVVERNEKLKQELAELNTSMGEEKEKRESDRSMNQVMNAELTKQNKVLNEQVAELKKEMNEGAYAKMKEPIAAAEDEMKKLQDTVKALKMENQGLRINADDVAKTNQSLLNEGEKYQSEIQDLRRSINQLEGSRNALRKENMKLYAEKLQIIEDM